MRWWHNFNLKSAFGWGISLMYLPRLICCFWWRLFIFKTYVRLTTNFRRKFISWESELIRFCFLYTRMLIGTAALFRANELRPPSRWFLLPPPNRLHPQNEVTTCNQPDIKLTRWCQHSRPVFEQRLNRSTVFAVSSMDIATTGSHPRHHWLKFLCQMTDYPRPDTQTFLLIPLHFGEQNTSNSGDRLFPRWHSAYHRTIPIRKSSLPKVVPSFSHFPAHESAWVFTGGAIPHCRSKFARPERVFAVFRRKNIYSTGFDGLVLFSTDTDRYGEARCGWCLV